MIIEVNGFFRSEAGLLERRRVLVHSDGEPTIQGGRGEYVRRGDTVLQGWGSSDGIARTWEHIGGAHTVLIPRSVCPSLDESDTTAERAASIMGGDGQIWTAPDGREWSQVCEDLGGKKDVAAAREHGYDEAYRFADGSIMAASGPGWDTHAGWLAAR